MSARASRAPLRSERRAVQSEPAPMVVPSGLAHQMLKYGIYWQDDDYGPGYPVKCQDLTEEVAEAELISSRLVGDRFQRAASLTHAPILDLDLPARLLPSRTPGHHHLYLDMEMTWRRYKALLKALAKAGVVEESWAKASIRGQQTLLRPPWRLGAAAVAYGVAHADIETRHILASEEDRESRDDYEVIRYTVLVPTTDRAKATYVSSRLRTNKRMHAPALDLDIPAALVPSTTPGHAHLYLDVEMNWVTYRRLLKALAKAGVIEKSWAKASIQSQQTLVRPPWLLKAT